jgi:hypothetical protein
LARRNRKLDYLKREAERVISIMRSRGATLHRTNRAQTVVWSLSTDGEVIPGAVALAIIGHREVVAVGDSLLGDSLLGGGVLSQTWRLTTD